MKLTDLIGYQLVSINEHEIRVRKNNDIFTLEIVTDEGDCCGYNDITTELFISDAELSRNPVITNVTVEDISHGDYYDGENVKLTFFGECNAMATIDSESSSGSGWCYGAAVCIVCKPLEIDEILTSW
jgi:hypothetical protein